MVSVAIQRNKSIKHYTQWHTISKKTLSCETALSGIKIEQ